MLSITIPGEEYYDEEKNEFITKIPPCTLQLEHSLVSLHKWEAKWHKPFLSTKEKTQEEILDYLYCMTITQNVKPDVFRRITPSIMRQINEYMEDSMTATTITDDKKGANRQIITAEVIYSWMIAYNIPYEYRKWHLNSLLTLIRVISIQNAPQKKMSKSEIYNSNRALNESRRKARRSKG